MKLFSKNQVSGKGDLFCTFGLYFLLFVGLVMFCKIYEVWIYYPPLFSFLFFRWSSVSGQPTPISTSPLLDPVKGIPSTPGPGDSQGISLWRPGLKVDSMKKSASAEKM